MVLGWVLCLGLMQAMPVVEFAFSGISLPRVDFWVLGVWCLILFPAWLDGTCCLRGFGVWWYCAFGSGRGDCGCCSWGLCGIINFWEFLVWVCFR